MRRFPSLSALIMVSVLVMAGVAGLSEPAGAQERPPDKEKPAPKAAGGGKLTPSQIKWIDERLLPAYAMGQAPSVVLLIRETLPKTSAALREAIDRELAERKSPPLERLLTDARLSVLRSGAANVVPPPSAQEKPLLTQELRRQVDELLADARSQPIFADPLPHPKTLREARDVLWSAHILNNTLRNAAYLATQAEALTAAAPAVRPKLDRKGTAPQAASATPFAEARETVVRMYRELDERAFEMRLRRIAIALQTLETSADIGERFLAAYAISVDGEQLQMQLKAPRSQPYERPALNAPELPARVKSQIERSQMLAGDLILKARQLFAGLHWWRRGRYGRGPEHFGLVKFAAALNNPAVNIALVMPLEAPTPADPAMTDGPASPDYDRRHHAWWSWENAKFESQVVDSKSSNVRELSDVKFRTLGHFDGFVGDRFY